MSTATISSTNKVPHEKCTFNLGDAHAGNLRRVLATPHTDLDQPFWQVQYSTRPINTELDAAMLPWLVST